MLKVGLTGGIGSGKSELSRFFTKWGAYVFDADKEAKIIIDTNESVQKEIIAEFDTNILNAENKINRKKLARIAFQDEGHQLRLNSIIHPYVFQEIDKQFDNVSSAKKHKIFVVDAALIYESGADTHMDFVIIITSLLRFRAERAIGRGNMTREDFMKRVDLQWTDEDRAHMADFIISNNNSLEGLKKDARKIFDELIY
tara:strand:+ start:4526 stop:5122 length:597 start_codon:yes stop_codon:yes gene_type:complete